MPSSQRPYSAARRLYRSTLYLAIGAALAGIAPLAEAQTASELKAQVDALQKRIAELERNQLAAAPANAVAAAHGHPFAQGCKPQSERSCPGDASEPFAFVGRHRSL